MKLRIINIFILSIFMGVIPVHAENGMVQLDDLILNLPEGWEVTITKPRAPEMYTDIMALMHVKFVYPNMEYEYGAKPDGKSGILTKNNYVKANPGLSISFCKPDKKIDNYLKNIENKVSPVAIEPLHLFAKKKNYWVLTRNTYASLKHAKEKELYKFLQLYLYGSKSP